MSNNRLFSFFHPLSENLLQSTQFQGEGNNQNLILRNEQDGTSSNLSQGKNKSIKKPIKPQSRLLHQDPVTGQLYLLPIDNESASSVAHTIRGYFERNFLPATVSKKGATVLIDLHEGVDVQEIKQLFAKEIIQLINPLTKSFIRNDNKSKIKINEKTYNRQLYYDSVKSQYYLLPLKGESVNKVAKAVRYHCKQKHVTAKISESASLAAVIVNIAQKQTQDKEIENIFMSPPIHRPLTSIVKENIPTENRTLYCDPSTNKFYIMPLENEELHMVGHRIRCYLDKKINGYNLYESSQDNVIYINSHDSETLAAIGGLFSTTTSRLIDNERSAPVQDFNLLLQPLFLNQQVDSMLTSQDIVEAEAVSSHVSKKQKLSWGNPCIFYHSPADLSAVDSSSDNGVNNSENLSSTITQASDDFFTERDFDAFNEARALFGSAFESELDEDYNKFVMQNKG